MTRALTLPTALALLTALAAPAAAAPPEPIEHEIFDSRLGLYPDLTRDALFDKYGVDAPSPTPLPFDVKAARFYQTVVDGLTLDADATAALARDGLVLVDPPRRYSMAAAYWALFTSDLPLLVTTDSVLDAMHRSFDDMLAELEVAVLSPMIRDVLKATRAAAVALAEDDPSLARAADDVDLYTTTALNLLGTDPGKGRLAFAPARVAEKTVLTLLAKVERLELENPAINGKSTALYGARRAVDWSQFKPRGHYTKSAGLKRYFRAMMWLGRADTGFEIRQARQLRAAALLSHAARTSGALDDLGAVKAVIDLFVGRSDELTPFQLADLMRDLKLAPAALERTADLARLVEQLAASGMGAQRIRSQTLVSNPRTAEKVPLPPLFQMFGQRFVIDSFALSKVVYDDIVFRGEKQNRRMPTGLDVLAALGNDVALWLLRGELDQWRYGANLAALRDVVGGYTDAHWQDSLYMQWLAALRTLNQAPEGPHAPAVMKGDAWGRKMLQTQLASWAQLRHDTILYAKQSYTASVGCLYPAGYVEPYPAFYDRLGAFARTASTRLGALKGLGRGDRYIGRYVRYFDGFAGHMQTLGALARKQLAAQPFSPEDEAFLRDTIERRMPAGGYDPKPEWNGWYMDLLYIPEGETVEDAVEWEPTIADVHTDPDGSRVLEVGTGDVHFVVAAIDNDGDTAVHVGPTFTYYAFTQPASDRLTDAQWQRRLRQKAPPRPAWITPLVFDGAPR